MANSIKLIAELMSNIIPLSVARNLLQW